MLRWLFYLFFGIAVLILADTKAPIHKERSNKKVIKPADTYDLLSSLVQNTSKQIKYGNAPNFLSVSRVKNFGYGHCGHYSELLSQKLWALGFEHNVIRLTTLKGAIHSVVEVLSHFEKFTLDPTHGIIYRGAVTDLVKNPTRATPNIPIIADAAKNYVGADFFGSVSLVFNDSIDSMSFRLHNYYIEKKFIDGKVVIGWPKGLDVHFVELVFGRKLNIQKTEWSTYTPVPALKKISLIPSKNGESLAFSILGINNINLDEFDVSVVASKESGEKILSLFSPIPTFIAFEGGYALIDTIKLRGESSKSYFQVDVGNTKDETAPGHYLFAPELFNKPLNSWGNVTQHRGKTYRKVNSFLHANNSHAAIQVHPLVDGVLDESGFAIEICYINKSNKNKTKLKIYSNQEKSYSYIGELPQSTTVKCSDFAVPVSLIRTTLGMQNSKLDLIDSDFEMR